MEKMWKIILLKINQCTKSGNIIIFNQSTNSYNKLTIKWIIQMPENHIFVIWICTKGKPKDICFDCNGSTAKQML